MGFICAAEDARSRVERTFVIIVMCMVYVLSKHRATHAHMRTAQRIVRSTHTTQLYLCVEETIIYMYISLSLL